MAESVASAGQRVSLHEAIGRPGSRSFSRSQVRRSGSGISGSFRMWPDENGGGAFVLIYLACVLLIGLPIMMSEILLGRRGRRNPVETMRILGDEESGQSGWAVVGLDAVLSPVSSSCRFTARLRAGPWPTRSRPATGSFVGADAATLGAEFGAFIGNPCPGRFLAYAVHADHGRPRQSRRRRGYRAGGTVHGTRAGDPVADAARLRNKIGRLYGRRSSSCSGPIFPRSMARSCWRPWGRRFLR